MGCISQSLAIFQQAIDVSRFLHGVRGGYASWMLRFPELHLSVVILFNHFLWDMQDYAIKVADSFLEEKTAPRPRGEPTAAPQQTAAPVELSAEQLEKRAGTYFSARRAASRQITYAEGRLRFQGFDLVPLSENLFFFEVEPTGILKQLPGRLGLPSRCSLAARLYF